MSQYRELVEHIRRAGHSPTSWIFQGIVEAVEGYMCTVRIGSISVPEVRLRPSTETTEGMMLIVPQIGSAVILASLSGDMSDLVVLSVDQAERILLHGDKLGGMVDIGVLTERLNTLERDINDLKQALSSWIPKPNDGGASLKGATASWTAQTLKLTHREDYEDKRVLH